MAYLALVLFGLLMASCVSNKKVTYLKNHEKSVRSVRPDTLLGTYEQAMLNYRLQTRDVLQININSLTSANFDIMPPREMGMNQLAARYPVLMGYNIDEYGFVSLPVIGAVQVRGLTVTEVRHRLDSILEGYLDEPSSEVRLLSFRFTLLGQVSVAGEYYTYSPNFKFLDALAMAGDVSEFGDRSRIKVVRSYEDRIETAYVNILDEQFINSEYYYIWPNDLIIVEPLGVRPFKLYGIANIGAALGFLNLILLITTLTTR